MDDTAAAAQTAASLRVWAIYFGGLIGPFGATVVMPMLPEVAAALDTSVSTTAWALTSYMVPFATLMLVSGTLADRWGRWRTVRWGYIAYAAASLVCAAADDVPLFLVGRAVQGGANAFTTPILIAALAEAVPPALLNGSLGRYGAMQSAGQSFAPLIGGVTAAADWRLAFVMVAVLSIGLALTCPRGPRTAPSVSRGNVASLANRRLGLASTVAFFGHSTTTAAFVLFALLASDRFELGPHGRGVVVACSGLAGLVAGGALGRLADRRGVVGAGAAASLLLAVAVAASGAAGRLPVLLVLAFVAGAAATGSRVTFTRLAVDSTPSNRGGATSVVMACQFLGGALAPVVWIPVYDRHALLGFVGAASGAVLAAVLLALAGRRQERSSNGTGNVDAGTVAAR